jgi:hypothetical protein
MERPQKETGSIHVNLGFPTTPTGWNLVSVGGSQGSFVNAMPRGIGAPPQQMQMMPRQQVGDGNIGQLLSMEECARLVRYVISINQFPAHEMILIGVTACQK